MPTSAAVKDPIPLMEGAIDAVFALKRKVREADERARTVSEESKMWKARYEKERRRVEELERELVLAQRRAASSDSTLPTSNERSAADLPQSPPPDRGGVSGPYGSSTRSSAASSASTHVLSPTEKRFAEQELRFRPPDDDASTVKSSDSPDIFTRYSYAIPSMTAAAAGGTNAVDGTATTARSGNIGPISESGGEINASQEDIIASVVASQCSPSSSKSGGQGGASSPTSGANKMKKVRSFPPKSVKKAIKSTKKALS